MQHGLYFFMKLLYFQCTCIKITLLFLTTITDFIYKGASPRTRKGHSDQLARNMAEKADILQIDVVIAGGSSRESSPDDEHRMNSMQQQHSMDSLILSGESSDDILVDDMDEEEAMGSCGEDGEEVSIDPEAMAMAATEGADDQSSVISTGAAVVGSTGAGGGGSIAAAEEVVGTEQQKRNKKKRRISSTRERKISISSSRLKVFTHVTVKPHVFLIGLLL